MNLLRHIGTYCASTHAYIFVSAMLQDNMMQLRKLLLTGSEPSPESHQYGGFAFVRGSFAFVQGVLTFKFIKNSTIYSVLCFNFGGFGLFFGGDKPTKAPRGDGTGRVTTFSA